MATFSGIGMIEKRDRNAGRAALPTGFYSEGSAGRSAAAARIEWNTQLSQKQLFSSDLGTKHLSILDWQTLRGSQAGRFARPRPPLIS